MSPGAKLFLTLGGVATVIGVVVLAGSKSANAAPGQPKPKPQVPGSNAPPDVIVPADAPPGSDPASLPPLVPNGGGGVVPVTPAQPSSSPPFVLQPAQPQPLPQPPQPLQPATPPGVTFSIPNPMGGAPLGTFDPATGNVFGPGGLIIGTFNPATGIFTASTGQQIQIPGFPSGGGLTPLPSVPVVPPAPPPPQPAQQQQQQPNVAPAPAPSPTPVKSDTAVMVATLLAAEGAPGWNAKDPSVSAWQSARPPLVVDGEFGPKSALTVAQEFGTVPLIRYWPKGSQKASALQAYKTALLQLANASTDPVRAQQLRLSAARENAQAFSTKGPLPALPSDQQIQLAKVA